ncbi:MAG: hypothetical protein KKF98_13810 [Bacteroidetes bacterium]|nr:hypothetical protein [Bacteroidota bacterium]
MKIIQRLSLILFALGMLTVLSCTKSEDPQEPVEAGYSSCIECHTNYAHLQKVYSPDTAAPAGGCGGSAPHYEPYDRVYMGGEGFQEFKASSHYSMGCTACHGGVDNVGDKLQAHSGDFIAHPSANFVETCGACHEDATSTFGNSLHNGYGQMRAVAMRNGLTGADDFDQLPAHQIEGYNKNCATCHGTCGNCHIVRPPIAGGGLAAGHKFTKTPDMVNVCVSCHTSRGGHAYLGVAPGTSPDVHLTNAGFDCLGCHSGHEMHGGTEKVEQRYAYSELPECEDCHTNLKTSNLYHERHINHFNCQVCHSQDYNNCGSCHIHGEGARIPSYMDYKIALNPLKDLKPALNFVTVRRTLAAPDSWSLYGVEQSATFSAKPTYNYTSPHNILRWTSRTVYGEGENCTSNCHIRNEDGGLVNKEHYLFMDDLLEWEKEATGHVTVDGKLPEHWFESKNELK